MVETGENRSDPCRAFASTMGMLIIVMAVLALTSPCARERTVLLGSVMLMPVFAHQLPRALPAGTFCDAWPNVLKWLALAVGVFVVAAHLLATRRVGSSRAARRIRARARAWFFLVHTPRMVADPTGPVGWSEMAESLAFSALAFLLAQPYRASCSDG